MIGLDKQDVVTITNEVVEEEGIEMDEEDQEQLESLTREERKIASLLESTKQIQTMKERYETKLLQITTQLDVLTVESKSNFS